LGDFGAGALPDEGRGSDAGSDGDIDSPKTGLSDYRKAPTDTRQVVRQGLPGTHLLLVSTCPPSSRMGNESGLFAARLSFDLKGFTASIEVTS
jgi:hypothetical protein